MFIKTVDSITKVFTKAIQELYALEEKEHKKIDRYDIVLAEVKKATQESELEIARAITIREKLQSIVA